MRLELDGNWPLPCCSAPPGCRSSTALWMCFSACLPYDHLQNSEMSTGWLVDSIAWLFPSPLSPLSRRLNASPDQDCTMSSLLSAPRSAARVCYLLKARFSLCVVYLKACTRFPLVHVARWYKPPAAHKYRVVLHFHVMQEIDICYLIFSHAPALYCICDFSRLLLGQLCEPVGRIYL